MAMTIEIPLFRVRNNGYGEFFVQEKRAFGWKRVSNDYGRISSAKAKLGDLVLNLIAKAE